MKKFQITLYEYSHNQFSVAGRLIDGDIHINEVFNQIHHYVHQPEEWTLHMTYSVALRISSIIAYSRHLDFLSESMTAQLDLEVEKFDVWEQYYTDFESGMFMLVQS